MVRRFCKI